MEKRYVIAGEDDETWVGTLEELFKYAKNGYMDDKAALEHLHFLLISEKEKQTGPAAEELDQMILHVRFQLEAMKEPEVDSEGQEKAYKIADLKLRVLDGKTVLYDAWSSDRTRETVLYEKDKENILISLATDDGIATSEIDRDSFLSINSYQDWVVKENEILSYCFVPAIFEESEKKDLSPERCEVVKQAMEAAGYTYDDLESEPGNYRFYGDYGTLMQMKSMKEAEEWLKGVVFDDPDISDRVEAILSGAPQAAAEGIRPRAAHHR